METIYKFFTEIQDYIFTIVLPLFITIVSKEIIKYIKAKNKKNLIKAFESPDFDKFFRLIL